MKQLFMLLCAVMAFAACEQAPIEEQSAIRYEAPDTITVGFEGDDTRIQLNAAQKTVWTKGDQVSVFYKSYDNLKFEFEGNTGDRDGTLKRVGGQHNGQTMDDVVVVYPYSSDYMITLSEGCVNATIPSTQTYLKGSYGVGDNLMIARSSFNQFSLKSVCGWLKIQLTGDGDVIERITFRGNDGEQVAGLVYVDATTAEATLATAKHNSDDNSQLDGTLVLDDSIYTEVTLDCGEGVALGKNATAFYIALPPQTFEKGFTVAIKDTEGYVMEQSTDKALTIERNHIQPMAAFEFINPATPSAPAPASNEIWYTATAKTEPYFDDFLTFGADVVSNVWDSETKRGIITFDGDITMIGVDAFNNCDKFTSITLPECVTSIGKNAFYDCDGLTEFTIPDSVTEIGSSAFYSCDKLTSVTIGDSVTTIGNSAFAYCSSLTSVTIGDSVTSIGNYAFDLCYSLTSVNIPDSVTTIGEYAFSYCTSLTGVNIPDSVTTIGNYAFQYCTSLTSVNIPDSVTTIGEYAFYGCSSLTSVNIPDSVTTIGSSAFRSCESLTEFTGKFAEDNGRILVIDGVLTAFAPAGITEYNIPDSVTSIGYAAFYSCDSLTSVNIPDSITKIGNKAFYNCTSLTSVNIPDSVTTIGNSAFEDCYSLKQVYCYATIPPSLGSFAFSDNASGRRIHVYEECVELYKSAWSSYKDSIYTNGKNCPETTTIQYTTNDGNIVTTKNMPVVSNIYDNGVGTLVVVGKIAHIPNDAFRDCSSLTSVNIPDSVTTIGQYAFYECASLKSATIPNSVTTIGYSAFYNCTSLTSVYCKAVTPPTLGKYVFDSNGSGRKIYVPAGSVETYKSATRWSEYASAIVGYDFENGVVVE